MSETFPANTNGGDEALLSMSDRTIQTTELSKRRVLEIEQDMAKKNLGNGRFVLLDIDPEKYPFQGQSVVEGNPQSAKFIRKIAPMYDPRTKILFEMSNQGPIISAFDDAREVLDAGYNLVLATDHSDLINVALAHAMLYTHLKGTGVDFRSSTIVNSPLQFIGAPAEGLPEPVPTISVLGLMCNHVYMSYAKTKSTEQSKLGSAKDVRGQRNFEVGQHLDGQLARGRQLLAIAESGTVDKSLVGELDTIELGGVNRGTANIMTREDTYVLSMVLRMLDGEPPVFQVVGNGLQKFASEKDVEDDMHRKAEALNIAIPGKNFVYAG